MPYHLSRSGKTLGVYSLGELTAGLHDKTLRHDDLIWRNGFDSWTPLESLRLNIAGPKNIAFWQSAPLGVAPSTCSNCSSKALYSLSSLHKSGGYIQVDNQMLLPAHAVNFEPPTRRSTLSTGLVYYLLIWPVANAFCVFPFVRFGPHYTMIGVLLSFACGGFLNYKHKKKISQCELEHEIGLYVWRCSYRCLSCGAQVISADSDYLAESIFK